MQTDECRLVVDNRRGGWQAASRIHQETAGLRQDGIKLLALFHLPG